MGPFNTRLATPQNLAMVTVGENNLLNRAGTTVTWAAGAGEYVTVQLQTNQLKIVCRSADDGQLVIPAEAMAHLSADATRAGVRVSRFVTTTVITDEPSAAVSVLLERRWVPGGERPELRFGQ